MKKIIHPCGKLSGIVDVPPDKSLTHRAILLSALSDGASTVHNPLLAADCLSTASCVSALGCSIEKSPGVWTINGRGLGGFEPPSGPLDCGNSGTTMRLLSGILAAQNFTTELTGDASLSHRPMQRIAAPLREMGASVTLRDGKFAPLKIQGTNDLTPVHYTSSVASAQVKSCVLLAGIHARGETSFEEPSMSRDHTERMMQAAGVVLRRKGNRVAVQGPARLAPQSWTIPGDISSAAFFIVAGLLVDGSRLELRSVNLNPTRTGLIDVLRRMGARIDVLHERTAGGEPMGDVVVEGRAALKAVTIDRSITPRLIDEIPILAVAATQADGMSFLRGIEELRVKETDRIAAIAKNLRAMGAHVVEEQDGLAISGPTRLRGAAVESFDDHRIAMAFAIAALIADGETAMHGSEAVGISYPGFWDTLAQIRA